MSLARLLSSIRFRYGARTRPDKLKNDRPRLLGLRMERPHGREWSWRDAR